MENKPTIQYYGEYKLKDAPFHQLIRAISEYKEADQNRLSIRECPKCNFVNVQTMKLRRRDRQLAHDCLIEIYRRVEKRRPTKDEISESLIEF